MTCSIGIAPNRFLAKTAANLHKPDGLDVITFEDLIAVYACLSLCDLCEINTRFEARLNACGILPPLDFLAALLEVLTKQVFQSIVGYHWYLRQHG